MNWPTHRIITVLIAFTLTVFPYAVAIESYPYQTYTILSANSALQFLSLIFTFLCFKRSGAHSTKLFWQYITIALLVEFITGLLSVFLVVNFSPLTSSFISLVSYFFILLAIETNPHLSSIPLNRYINGRVPAIFFVIANFCYFVLLPVDLSIDTNAALPYAYYFHLSTVLLIFIRLCTHTFTQNNDSWANIYAALAVATFALLIDNLNTLMSLNGYAQLNDLLITFVKLAPYLFLIIAAQIYLSKQTVNEESKETPKIENYVFLMVLILVTIHIIGYEFELDYLVQGSGQSYVTLISCFLGLGLIAFIVHKKQLQKVKILTQSEKNQKETKRLSKEHSKLSSMLVNSEEKAIVNASNNAILTVDIIGTVLSANPAAVQVFQYLERDIVGKKICFLFNEDDDMHGFFNFKSNVFSLQRKEEGISTECLALRSDGVEFPVQVELQWAERNQKPLVIVTFINLTARKLAEKQALDLKDKFIANISHEFRTPLTIINGILERYITQSTDSRLQKELFTAKRNGLRLVRMVEQLLELSKLSDDPKLSLASYRLTTLLAMPIDSFKKLAEQNQLMFESHIPQDIWLDCDAQSFEKIIFNLLANAIKYTPKGGTVAINALADNGTIFVDVLDTGIGINAESQEMIFERFQRANDSKNHNIFGVGIGLSLVSELVKAHGWRINVASEYNQGSKFTLLIPQAEAKVAEHKLPSGISEDEIASLMIEKQQISNQPNNHSQQVVLVIEDNIDMQSHIKQVIEQQHHCILALSGELGIKLAKEYIPDIIVCDIMLTGIDGFEVLEQLKSNELTAHIPVVLLTARSDLDSRLKGLTLQAEDYVSKPFNQKELLARIDNILKNRQQLQSTHYQQFEQNKLSTLKEESVDQALEKSPNIEEVTLTDKFIEKLTTVVANNYAEPELDISILANHLALSERQLQRKMKAILGTTPNNFIKEFRLKKAAELLKTGSQIGRIALDVGFSSQTYFGRCFKELYDCTPKQYQGKYKL